MIALSFVIAVKIALSFVLEQDLCADFGGTRPEHLSRGFPPWAPHHNDRVRGRSVYTYRQTNTCNRL